MADSEPGQEVARSELRASHEDRDQVVELLRVSAGDGRLTADELDERLEQAMTARTYGELARLVADLPAAGSAASAPAPRAKEVMRIECGSGHTVKNGRWCPRPLTSGGCPIISRSGGAGLSRDVNQSRRKPYNPG